jgi:hypothetical protein
MHIVNLTAQEQSIDISAFRSDSQGKSMALAPFDTASIKLTV